MDENPTLGSGAGADTGAVTLALSAVVLPDRHPVSTFPDDGRGVPATALAGVLAAHGL